MKKPMYYNINIPLKPYLKKYCLKNLTTKNGIVTINRKNYLSIFILKMLTKQPGLNRMEIKTHDYEILSLQILDDVYQRVGDLSFTKENILFLNRSIDNLFRKELTNFLHIKKEEYNIYYPKKRFRLSFYIEFFLSYYDISLIDIDIDTLKKHYQRN